MFLQTKREGWERGEEGILPQVAAWRGVRSWHDSWLPHASQGLTHAISIPVLLRDWASRASELPSGPREEASGLGVSFWLPQASQACLMTHANIAFLQRPLVKFS